VIADARFDRGDLAVVALFASIYGAFRLALEHAYALLDPDVALEMLAAAPLLHGGLPYVEAISHRGPWLSVVYALGLAIGGGPFATGAVHVVCACVFVLGAAGLYRGAKSAYGRAAAIATLATLLALATFIVPDADTWTLNADALAASWIALSIGVLLLDGSPATTLAAGVLCALGFLTKQNAFPFLVAPVPYLLWAQTRAHAAAWSAGVAIPIAALFAIYLTTRHLAEMWYGFYEYNAGYATVGGTTMSAQRLFLFIWPFLTWGCLSAVPLVGIAIERRRTDGLALSLLAAGVLAAAAPGRSFYNYLWSAHVPFALVFGAGLVRCVRALRTRSPVLIASLAALLVAAWSLPRFVGNAIAIPRFLAALPSMAVGDAYPPKVGTRAEHVATIQAWSNPDDTIYVNAYAPELYVLAQRRPASRHVISNFVEGFYPTTMADTILDAGRAAQLFADLDRNQPKVIVDAGLLGYIAPIHSALHDRLYALVDAAYHPVATGIFVRND
jgi:hypothetical protein